MRYGRDWGLGVGDWGERSADSDTIATVGLDHCADPAVRQGEPVEVGFDSRRSRGGDDQHDADAAGQGAPHLRVGDRAFALQPLEHRWHHDRRGLDTEAHAVGPQPADVLETAMSTRAERHSKYL